MKKALVNMIMVVIIATTMSGCADNKRISTVENNQTVTRVYAPYGIFSQNKENPNVEYEVSIGNVVWGVILFETIIAPIIIFGWYLWEPVGPKVTNSNLAGVVS
jgi:hypothetical protein